MILIIPYNNYINKVPCMSGCLMYETQFIIMKGDIVMQSDAPESIGSIAAAVAPILMLLFALYSMAHVWG